MRRINFFNRIKSAQNKKLEKKVIEYSIQLIQKKGFEILQTNFLNIFYENLTYRQQKKFDFRIKKFLIENQKLIEDLISLEEKRNKLDIYIEDFPFKIHYKSEKLNEKILEVDYRNFSRDYESIKNLLLFFPTDKQEEFINTILSILYEFLKKELLSPNDEVLIRKKIERLNLYFQFTKEEVEFLIFTYYLNTNQILQEIFDELLQCYNLTEILSCFLNSNELEIKKLINRNSKLQFFQIIYIEKGNIQLNEDIYDYFIDLTDNHFIERFFTIINPSEEEILDIKLFEYHKDKIEIIKQLLLSDDTVNILFYGKTGTGKTSLAKSIVHSLGKKIIYVSNEVRTNHYEWNAENSGRLMNLILANQYALQNDGIVIMDEADEFLNSHFSLEKLYLINNKNSEIKKNWLNQFLEQHKGKIIWITNYIELMDQSVKRRFQYSIQFSNLNGEVREQIFKTILKKYKLNHIIQIEDLQEYFNDSLIPIGVIENSLNQIRNIYSKNKLPKKKIIQFAKELIESSFRLINNSKYKGKNIQVYFNFDEKYIHCSLGVPKIKEKIQNFLRTNKNKIKNLSILFYGPSGTGKTEFARYLVKIFKLRLIEIQPSDIQNPLFGVSEKLIRDYFYISGYSNYVLLINDIDVFLSENTNSIMYPIKLQFTQELENFRGILIGTTNYIDKIDKTALRRFHLKIEFFPIRKTDIEEVFLKFFKDQLASPYLTFEQKENLKSLENICFGDFYSVKRQIETEGELYFEEIYKLLKEEMYYRLHQRN